MRILIDINHPADVHQFKNLIWEMQKKGHKFKIVARDREGVFELLKKYKIDFVPRKGFKGIFGRAFGIIMIDYFLYKIAKKFNPDILIGGPGNCYIAQTAFLLGKKSIIFDDTEYSTIQNWLTFPLANFVCTPSCYWLNVGKKQKRYNGYQELSYLHPKYFRPNKDVLKELGLKDNEKFVIIRLVSWEANHDIGDYGFRNAVEFVKLLRKRVKIFITSEKDLPKELEKFRVRISLDKMHDVLYHANMLIGESSTMASEAALLGTPAIFISKSKRGYTNELEKKYKLLFNFEKQEDAMKKALELLKKPNLKEEWREKRNRVLAEKIDVTKWMINFVSNIMISREVILVGQYDPFDINLGGVEIYTKNLYEELLKNNIKVRIFGWSKHRKEKNNFYPVVISNKLLGRKFSFYLFVKSLFLPIKKESVLIVDRPDRVIPFIFRKNKIICILHGSHAKNVANKKGALVAYLYKGLEKIALKRSDYAISVSNENKDYYLTKFPFLKNKISVIPTGVSKKFRPLNKRKLRQKYGLSINERVFLFVGRIEREKRIDEVIRKFYGLNAKLVIVGEGREEDTLKNLVEHLKLKNVVFLKSIVNDKIPEIMNCADALILFSEYEGMPNVVLEALACGVPVIGSNVGDIKQVVNDGKTGYIVDENNLKDKINLIIKNGHLMKENCIRKAKDYSWEKIGGKFVKVLKNETNY